MATTVNLNLGGESGASQTYTLVLTAPYTEPAGNLLVLRSAPDIAPVTGTLAVTNTDDRIAAEGGSRKPVEPRTATLAVTNRPDTAAFVGEREQAVTGELAVTGRDDALTGAGAGYTGLAVRRGTMAITSQADTAEIEGLWTMKWPAVLNATSSSDTAQITGDFIPYQGPGYLLVESRQDTAAFLGSNVYDIAGDLAATEANDAASFVVITNTQLEVEVTETVIATDSAIGDVSTENIVDRLIATDVLDYSRDMDFADTVIASDALSSELFISPVLSDVVVAHEALSAQLIVAAADSAILSDTLSALITPEGLTETAAATDSLVSSSGITGVLADTAYSRDALAYHWVGDVTETLTATDSLTTTQQILGVLTDIVIGADLLQSPLTVYAPVLADTALLTDVLTSTTALQLAGVLADTALVGDALYAAEAQTVLVVNAETGAVSTYQFTPAITGMAEYQGVLYLAGPDGLYALDAESDGDGGIVWTLRTGFSNLGTDRLKRVQDCNFQARTEGDTTFQVITDRYGQKQEWNYQLPPLTRDSYRDGVVKVGRGVQSVYWQFAAEGLGPAEIDQLRLVVEPLSRRR